VVVWIHHVKCLISMSISLWIEVVKLNLGPWAQDQFMALKLINFWQSMVVFWTTLFTIIGCQIEWSLMILCAYEVWIMETNFGRFSHLSHWYVLCSFWRTYNLNWSMFYVFPELLECFNSWFSLCFHIKWLTILLSLC
jgi:hypothetical protein